MTRLAEIDARLLEIRSLLEGAGEANLDELETEIRALNEEKSSIEKRRKMFEGINIIARKTPEPTPGGDEQEQFRDFGEFLQTVKYNPHDPALRAKEMSDKTQKRFMNMGFGAGGGFIVPEQFSNDIKMVSDQAAIFRPRAQVIPAGDPPDAAITIPALDQSGARGVYAGVQVTWIGEGEQKPETEPAFREIKLEPNEVAAHVVITDKLLRNSAAAGALVSSLLRKAIIAAEEDAFLSGNGAGQPLGILGHPATINVGRAGANLISYADITAMYARAKFGGSLAWIGSQTILPQLMNMQDANQNGNIWQPNAREGAPGTLIGLPFLLNDQSPVLGAEGDLILVDLDYYLIKDGSGISISMSEHPLFTQNRTIIKAFWNVDGQPWLSTPLLARDGVSTVSPFVALR